MQFTSLASWVRALPRFTRTIATPVVYQRRMSIASVSTPAVTEKRAALMIVGDEVLNGSIQDANTPFLAKFLHARGVDVVRVEIVPDDPAEIAETCLKLRDRVGDDGFVFTSGGIGPTHDDCTYESIANALGLSIQLHQPTVALMKEHYGARGMELNESRLRMAQVPTPCEVLVTPGLWVPLVVAGGNVYILPGIPRLFQSMIEAHGPRFTSGTSTFYATELYTQIGEGDVAGPLTQVAKTHPQVRIGSYPNTQFDMNRPDDGLTYRVKLAVEGRDEEAVRKAVEAIQAVIPSTTRLPTTTPGSGGYE